jgi:hypothetical protein
MNRTKVSKEYMKNSNRDRFDGRLKTASEAKQHRLERFKAAADDPEKQARRAERDAVAAAREAERKARAIKLLREKEDIERQQAEAAEREVAQAAAREAGLEAKLAETADREIAQKAAREAERQTERDRRYAARRNRKR